MSPEQCQGRKDIDGRSDVYSVGIMLFELLTGDLPFKGDSGLSIMIKQVKEKMPSLAGKMKSKSEKVDPDFSVLGPELEAIIEQLKSLMDDLDIQIVPMKEKISNEVRRFKLFQQMLTGTKAQIAVKDIDIRNYAKFILQEGNIDEKREFFRCLNSDILLKDKVISLE